MTDLAPGRAAELTDVLRQACARTGLGDAAGHAELIKYTNNAVYRLRGAATIARVGIGSVGLARAPRLVAVAKWLAQQDSPTVRLSDVDRPVYIGDGYAVTFWHELDSHPPGSGWTGTDLARTLVELHRTPIESAAIAEWNPFAAADQRLAAADGINSDDLDWLTDQWNCAREQFERIAPARAVIHGDAHTGNLLRDPSGRIMLADLDSTGIGPVAWDLVVCAVGAQRFGRTGFYEEFSAAYGWDVTQTSEWPTLRRIRELILVTSALPDLGRRPEIAAEHQHRLRTLREETLNARWHPYR